MDTHSIQPKWTRWAKVNLIQILVNAVVAGIKSYGRSHFGI